MVTLRTVPVHALGAPSQPAQLPSNVFWSDGSQQTCIADVILSPEVSRKSTSAPAVPSNKISPPRVPADDAVPGRPGSLYVVQGLPSRPPREAKVTGVDLPRLLAKSFTLFERTIRKWNSRQSAAARSSSGPCPSRPCTQPLQEIGARRWPRSRGALSKYLLNRSTIPRSMPVSAAMSSPTISR